ncbi:MAG: hypothetical protein HY236_12775 [Acidobacteria bacterium]|nr:hypothetical protein [Acidobacteriota bacterium]
MVRNFLAAVVAAVLTGTLLWGGCVSCQQLFSKTTKDNACCLPSGQCKNAAPVETGHQHCKSPTAALEQYVKGDPDGMAKVPGVVVPAAAFEIASGATIAAAAPDSLAPPGDQSPQDLFRLYSTFRI